MRHFKEFKSVLSSETNQSIQDCIDSQCKDISLFNEVNLKLDETLWYMLPVSHTSDYGTP